MVWIEIGAADKIVAGEAREFEIENRPLAIYNVDGEFFCTQGSCTHEEASLAEGFLEDHLIECPLHGSQFDLRTGAVLSLPAVFPVTTYLVESRDGVLWVDI